MKGAAQRWVVTGVAAMAVSIAAQVAAAVELTDADRVYQNYTRETATVAEGQVRVEIRGMKLGDEGTNRLNVIGLRLKDIEPDKQVTNLDAGKIDLVTSYGFAKGGELGLIIPALFQSLRFSNAARETNEDIGDLLLYGKLQRPVATHCAVGAGLELSMPNGPKDKGFGTGEFGVNPVVSTRYQNGKIGIGANAGYQMYQGDAAVANDVFNWGVEVLVRPSDVWVLRTELAGRVFNSHGTRYDDLMVMPGIDFNLANNLTIRPEGMAGGTNTALDWGIGVGIAATF